MNKTTVDGTKVVQITDYPMTLDEVVELETEAKRLYQSGKWLHAHFCVCLRRLQDGRAHVASGFEDFSVYAEATFDALSPDLARKLSIEGSLLMILDEAGRISLEIQTDIPLPGSWCLRKLSALQTKHGHETMLAMYDEAVQLRPNRVVTEIVLKEAEKNVLRRLYPEDIEVLYDGEEDEEETDEDEEIDPDDVELGEQEIEADPEEVHEMQDVMIQARHDMGIVKTAMMAIDKRLVEINDAVLDGFETKAKEHMGFLREDVDDLDATLETAIEALRAVDEARKSLAA